MRRFPGRKVLGPVAVSLAVTFTAIQFVPVERSNEIVTAEVSASPEARAILRRACYDCHSHETMWPWYSRIAPVSWIVARDVRDGRDELNFSTWDRYTIEDQVEKRAETWEEVAEGEMPPRLYLPLHRDAVLSTEDRAILRDWALNNP